MRFSNKWTMFGAIAAAGIAITTTAVAAPPKPKISVKRAKSVAAHKVHGKAVSAKYEFEDGHWQYAVLVTRGKSLYEVEVNAQTGKVLDSERTSAAEERSEAAADQRAAHKKGGGSHANAARNSTSETAESGEQGEKGEAGEGSEKK
ncbi:MAG TPA: PepSY domain-containing protein [Armatimonadota bacterium]|nr:PepSY domain-containing protein [Armatimonadota bacterium]